MSANLVRNNLYHINIGTTRYDCRIGVIDVSECMSVSADLWYKVRPHMKSTTLISTLNWYENDLTHGPFLGPPVGSFQRSVGIHQRDALSGPSKMVRVIFLKSTVRIVLFGGVLGGLSTDMF